MARPDLSRPLRHVRTTVPVPPDAEFPDFLIVGPQRTGTTWLHAHLRRHPQVFLSEPKELFYFSSIAGISSQRFPSAELAAYVRFFRDPPWRRLARNAYSLLRYGVPYRPRVRGEATASYAALSEEVIDDVVSLNPEIRVILMIRNPVERAWSHAKKDLARKRGRSIHQVPPEEVLAFFDDPYQIRCGSFVETADRWSARLKPGHLFLGLFDDVADHPAALLLAVMRFLGVDADPRYIGRDVTDPINPTPGEAMPPQYREHLDRRFAPELALLEERFGLRWPLLRERAPFLRVI